MDNIFYSIRNGKNPKYSYYLKSLISQAVTFESDLSQKG